MWSGGRAVGSTSHGSSHRSKRCRGRRRVSDLLGADDNRPGPREARRAGHGNGSISWTHASGHKSNQARTAHRSQRLNFVAHQTRMIAGQLDQLTLAQVALEFHLIDRHRQERPGSVARSRCAVHAAHQSGKAGRRLSAVGDGLQVNGDESGVRESGRTVHVQRHGSRSDTCTSERGIKSRGGAEHRARDPVGIEHRLYGIRDRCRAGREQDRTGGEDA